MKIGIRAKAILISFLFIGIPCIGTWLFLHGESKDKAMSQIEHRLFMSTERQINHIDEWMDGNTRAMQAMSKIYENSSRTHEMGKLITGQFVKGYPWLIASFITDENGQQIVRNNDEKLSDISEREYFKTAMYGEITSQIAISKANKQPVLLSAAPYYDTNGKKALGILGYSAELTTVSKTILNDKIGHTGYSFMFDRNGILIAHPSPTKLDLLKNNKGENYNKHPAAQQHQRLVRFSENGKDWVAYSDQTRNGWTVVTVMEEDEALQPIQELNKRDMIYLTLIMIFVSLAAFAAGHWITLKTKTLHTLVTDMMEGADRLNELDELQTGDEIEELSDIFSSLIQKQNISTEND